MWWIFGGKFSVHFPQGRRLKICDQKLHHIVPLVEKKLVTWEHPH